MAKTHISEKTIMYKPDGFIKKLKSIGENVLLFENALILRPEMIEHLIIKSWYFQEFDISESLSAEVHDDIIKLFYNDDRPPEPDKKEKKHGFLHRLMQRLVSESAK